MTAKLDIVSFVCTDLSPNAYHYYVGPQIWVFSLNVFVWEALPPSPPMCTPGP